MTSLTSLLSHFCRIDLSAHLSECHLKPNPVPIEAVCRRCYEVFDNYQTLRQHILMDHDEGLFQCRYHISCEFIGESRSVILEHATEHLQFGEHEDVMDPEDKANPLLTNLEFRRSLKAKLNPTPVVNSKPNIRTIRLKAISSGTGHTTTTSNVINSEVLQR